MSKRIIFILLFIFLSFNVSAQKEYHLKLLAVQEVEGKQIGSDADLFLELRSGSGRVYLDTYPLTKIDTQISTRFAKDIACKHFKMDCSNYDFIYTIKSGSPIIGGPSAGAAITSLTTIAVLGLDYDENISLTGTINSGGLVGQVGGIKEKIQAGSNINLNKVLIPKWTNYENKTNYSLVEYAKDNLSLEVVEVADIDDVLYQLTGLNLNTKSKEVIEDESYQKIMKLLMDVLCNRMNNLSLEILNKTVLNTTSIRKERIKNETLMGNYYSAASLCFGSNIILREQIYFENNFSSEVINKKINNLNKKILILKKRLEKEKLNTISDLQTYMVVSERIDDSKLEFDKLKNTTLKQNYSLLAYAEERFFSAISWMQFFSMPGKLIKLDNESLEKTCKNKILEAEERFQYVNIYFPTFSLRENIDTAEKSANNKNYPLCIIQAIQAKAQANAVLSSIGLEENTVYPYLENKQNAAARVISENTANGLFPILGFSYYNYAKSLKENEPFTALLYLEYSLEMSDLAIYFPEIKYSNSFVLNKEHILLFEGFILGVFVTLLIMILIFRKKK